MVEQFAIWIEDRENATVEKPAPKKKGNPTVQLPKYPTLPDLLGISAAEREKAARLTDEESHMAELLAAGEIDFDDLAELRSTQGFEAFLKSMQA